MAPAATQVAGGPPRAVKTSGGGGEEENLAFRAFFRDAVLPAISKDRAAPAAAATDGPEHAELMKTGAGRDIIAHAAPMLENISVLKIGRALRGKADAFRLVGAMLGKNLETKPTVSGTPMSEKPPARMAAAVSGIRLPRPAMFSSLTDPIT